MVHVEVFAGGWRKAFLAPAQTMLQLVFTRGVAEVSCRPADIVNVAFEVGALGELSRLGENRLFTAAGDHPALVQRNGAKIAVAKAAAVVGD